MPYIVFLYICMVKFQPSRTLFVQTNSVSIRRFSLKINKYIHRQSHTCTQCMLTPLISYSLILFCVSQILTSVLSVAIGLEVLCCCCWFLVGLAVGTKLKTMIDTLPKSINSQYFWSKRWGLASPPFP